MPPETPLDISLPPVQFRMGGEHFRSDEQFVAGARADVRKLMELVGLSRESRLLDWGCGVGRLAIGIRYELGSIADYHGVDLQLDLIEWAIENLTDEHTRFTRVDQRNERYNPDGTVIRRIPAGDLSVDVFYAYSVFSHMLSEDTAAYLGELARLLSPDGRAFVTAFVAEGVAECEENPSDFTPLQWVGRLHCVRFEKGFFEGLVRSAGLEVIEFREGQETDGQSLYILAKP